MLTFSQKLKSKKQTIFLVEGIKRKYICHLTNCLSGIYLGIQKYLMFEVFTFNAITVKIVNKTRNVWGLYIYIYYTFL